MSPFPRVLLTTRGFAPDPEASAFGPRHGFEHRAPTSIQVDNLRRVPDLRAPGTSACPRMSMKLEQIGRIAVRPEARRTEVRNVPVVKNDSHFRELSRLGRPAFVSSQTHRPFLPTSGTSAPRGRA
jgi:hypothetical protein